MKQKKPRDPFRGVTRAQKIAALRWLFSRMQEPFDGTARSAAERLGLDVGKVVRATIREDIERAIADEQALKKHRM